MHDRIFTTIFPRRLVRTAGGLFASALLALAAVPACAEEDEPSFEQSIIRGLLGISSQPDIDYRERSPLVIPPGGDLPTPEATTNVQRTPAWPHDPDAAKRKAASTRSKAAIDAYREAGRNLTPEELRRGARRQGEAGPAVTLSDNQMGRPLRPAEMGETKSLFGLMSAGGGNASAPETFSGEPTRSKLTEPPTGYRTPSPGQPYAPPKDSGSWFKALDIFDRGTTNPR